MTPAHETAGFAELVCSNSLKSKLPHSPAGVLKSEMAALGSLILEVAERHSVPAGEALAVDREAFSKEITERLESHQLVTIVREPFVPEMIPNAVSEGPVILATGPLTSPELSEWLAKTGGKEHLYFYDAVSPTVEAASVDRSLAFAQSRYDKGGDDYLNCPFNKEEYEAFVAALISAERAPIHAFEAGGKRDAPESEIESNFLEKIKYFAGCTPIEAIAEKGARSLAFGNFKPVGLTDPRTGRRPWAALQLRPENRDKTLYSLVACQTRLKWGEQKRVFQMVPGLQDAEFVRYGVIHRNTYVEAPQVLTAELELKLTPGVFVSGQLTGVEGYVESAAMGLFSALAIWKRLQGSTVPMPSAATAYGALLGHLQDETERDFAPMNINWGLLPDPPTPMRDKGLKRQWKLEQAQHGLTKWLTQLEDWKL